MGYAEKRMLHILLYTVYWKSTRTCTVLITYVSFHSSHLLTLSLDCVILAGFSGSEVMIQDSEATV
jgi:hypothetical protein